MWTPKSKNRVLAALRSYTNTLYHHPKEAKSIIAQPPGNFKEVFQNVISYRQYVFALCNYDFA